MPTFSEGVITQFSLFLAQSCLQFVPAYVIQKFYSHLFVDVIKLFLPNVVSLEIPVFCCRYEVVQWWSQCLGKRKYSKHNDQIIRAY